MYKQLFTMAILSAIILVLSCILIGHAIANLQHGKLYRKISDETGKLLDENEQAIKSMPADAAKLTPEELDEYHKKKVEVKLRIERARGRLDVMSELLQGR